MTQSKVGVTRYRHVYPRNYTEDIKEKRDATHIFNEFYKCYLQKLTVRAKRLCFKYKVAPFVHEDCVQGAMLVVYKAIDNWDPVKGNLYTYTYMGQLKAMVRIIREYHANRAYSKKPIVRFIGSENDTDWEPGDLHNCVQRASYEEDKLHDAIYLRKLLGEQMQRDPKRVSRFILYALDGNCVSQLARESVIPVSKQAYFNSVTYTRKQLRKKVRVHYA